MEQYSENPKKHTKFEIDLKYLNGTSIRYLLSILMKLKAINDNGNNVMVNWNVPKDADDLRDLSENVLNDLQLPHHIYYN